MDEKEFAARMKVILDRDEEPTMASSLEGWDSLAKISTAAFLNSKFKIKVTLHDLQQMQTLGDLYAFSQKSAGKKEA